MCTVTPTTSQLKDLFGVRKSIDSVVTQLEVTVTPRGLREVGFLNLGSWPLPAPASSPHSPIRSPKHLFGVMRVFGVTQGPVICADGPLGFCVEYGSRGRDQMLALLSACANLWPCLQLGCRLAAASKLARHPSACWLPHPTRTLASVSRGVSKVPP